MDTSTVDSLVRIGEIILSSGIGIFAGTRLRRSQIKASLSESAQADAKTVGFYVENQEKLLDAYSSLGLKYTDIFEKYTAQEVKIFLLESKITHLEEENAHLREDVRDGLKYKGLYEAIQERTKDYPQRLKDLEDKLSAAGYLAQQNADTAKLNAETRSTLAKNAESNIATALETPIEDK